MDISKRTWKIIQRIATFLLTLFVIVFIIKFAVYFMPFLVAGIIAIIIEPIIKFFMNKYRGLDVTNFVDYTISENKLIAKFNQEKYKNLM